MSNAVIIWNYLKTFNPIFNESNVNCLTKWYFIDTTSPNYLFLNFSLVNKLNYWFFIFPPTLTTTINYSFIYYYNVHRCVCVIVQTWLWISSKKEIFLTYSMVVTLMASSLNIPSFSTLLRWSTLERAMPGSKLFTTCTRDIGGEVQWESSGERENSGEWD